MLSEYSEEMEVQAEEGAYQDVLIEEGYAQNLDGSLFVITYGLVVDLQCFGNLAIRQSFEIGHFKNFPTASGKAVDLLMDGF